MHGYWDLDNDGDGDNDGDDDKGLECFLSSNLHD